MSDEAKADYPVFDHDQHGHIDPTIDVGRVYFDEEAGKVVCSIHGDTCATDGSLLRDSTVAEQVGINADGVAIFDHDNQKKVGTSRLYRCTVCGQGTWSDGTVVPDPIPAS